MSQIVACICEGAAEKAIMELLLFANKLRFTYDDVIDKTEPILGSYYRNARNFENDYLTKYNGDNTIVIYYVHDKKTERYKLKAKYNDFVKYKSFLTRPEIEMLYIISVNKYHEYKTKYNNLKPSHYVKTILRVTRVKDYEFIKNHFANISLLIDSIRKHKKYYPHEHTIYDLLDTP